MKTTSRVTIDVDLGDPDAHIDVSEHVDDGGVVRAYVRLDGIDLAGRSVEEITDALMRLALRIGAQDRRRFDLATSTVVPA